MSYVEKHLWSVTSNLWLCRRLHEILCKTVEFAILRAPRTVQVPLMDHACVVSPPEGRTGPLVSLAPGPEVHHSDSGSFAGCPLTCHRCCWYPEGLCERKGRRAEREDVHEILSLTFLLILLAIETQALWSNYQSCGKMQEAGAP